ncbi:MAG: ABC transporter permease [Chloroflexi bacterium]|jgi:putative ABC transport system permease protein|nr:ABC transporter permease [Chloroflexota bacterium]MBT7080033.1 ABC transporter permease [Chloroflexota bacterium]MBT7289893.1 ABC transporter permease [Chloroflexota bacterium]
MEKLFGIPMNQLMVALLIIFGVGIAVMALIALRNRVLLKMAVRNIPRRRTQTILVVLGLMMASLLFSASFSTGDTLTHSIRLEALAEIGEVDVIVQTEGQDVSNQDFDPTQDFSEKPSYFAQTYFETVRERLSSVPEVEGVAPLISEVAPVLAPTTRLSEPQIDILGYAQEWMDGFDRLVDSEGNTLSVSGLTAGQVYVSSEISQKLEVGSGDTIMVFLGPLPTDLEVVGVYEKGANPAGKLSLVMPLSDLQTLTGTEGMIDSIIITNKGDVLQGSRHTDVVLSSLAPLMEGNDLEAVPVKRDAIDVANEAGSIFSTIFLIFGQFSIAAGILLIFLIFVMLAAERKRELGIARAVGMQRNHVVRLFAFEGAVYSLIAAAVGALLGVAVAWIMVRIIGIAFGQMDLNLTFALNWRSVIIAYTLGMAITFAVVLISSWRVSRLNIVRAIRDIPEPSISSKTMKGLLLAVMVPVLGLMLTVVGVQGDQMTAFLLGVSLVIIGLPLLARRFGLPDRAVFTLAGLGLVVLWLLPTDVRSSILPDAQEGMELFFLSGIMIILGAVWTVIYNSDLLLAAIVRVFGRIRGLPPVLKTAVSYPMKNRFRTGMTLAMFSLVVFTIMVISFFSHSMSIMFEDTERLSGGFHIRANTSYANPIADIQTAIDETDDLVLNDFQTIGSFAGARVKVNQEGTDQKLSDFYIQGVNTDYTDNVTYDFAMMAQGYDSPRQVWQALQDESGAVVVSSMLVPVEGNLGVDPDAFRLEGFRLTDGTMPEIYIQVYDPITENEQRLRVIGVLDQSAFYTGGGMITSQENVNTLRSQVVLPQSYMFWLKDSLDAEATAKALESHFLENGMQTEVMADEIRQNASATGMMFNLFQGFMGLGLVVGVAALGVIAARSVVERRQQIGVLRALGFQKSMVQLSFLLESSFIALLGIVLGIALGSGLSYNLIAEMSSGGFEGMTYQVPWLNIVVVAIIAYGASLLTTYLPARQASKVYPAKALRYE